VEEHGPRLKHFVRPPQVDQSGDVSQPDTWSPALGRDRSFEGQTNESAPEAPGLVGERSASEQRAGALTERI
jgi:hypothetical protein